MFVCCSLMGNDRNGSLVGDKEQGLIGERLLGDVAHDLSGETGAEHGGGSSLTRMFL